MQLSWIVLIYTASDHKNRMADRSPLEQVC
jgi:hypothetical protein